MHALLRQMFGINIAQADNDLEAINEAIENVPDFDPCPGATPEAEPFQFYRFMVPPPALRSQATSHCPIPSTSTANDLDDSPQEALLQSDLSNQPWRVYPSPPALSVRMIIRPQLLTQESQHNYPIPLQAFQTLKASFQLHHSHQRMTTQVLPRLPQPKMFSLQRQSKLRKT